MMMKVDPPEIEYSYATLPLTKLHYVTCGSGPPLIMVPATISKIDNWLALAQFISQRFTVHFFELPGHGKSTPFEKSYDSKFVAETVESLLDYLDYDKVSLMGFSFGGVLSLHTLNLLQDRIDKVILLSPCVTNQAITLSDSRKVGLKRFAAFMKRPGIQSIFVKLLHSANLGCHTATFIRRLGKVEDTIPLEEVLCALPASTLEVLIYQANEILSIDFPELKSPLPHTCYFAMSINDPVLDFGTTLGFLEAYFENVVIQRFTFPYHQPPSLPTFDELNQDYGQFLDLI